MKEVFLTPILFTFSYGAQERIAFYTCFESRTSLQIPLYLYEQSGFIQEKQSDFLINRNT